MSKFFIRRPIVAMVIAILMVIAGVVSLLGLPTAQFPDIVPPEILVQATYPGADARTLEQAVATPIEQQMNGVDRMNYMESTNASNGVMQLTVDFDVASNADTDQILSQLRVSQAQSQLPAQVTIAGLTVQKSLSSPLMLLAISSPQATYDGVFLANYAYINLVDEVTRVNGVSRVQVFGAGQYALRVWVKPDQLAKLGVTVTEIVSALQVQNNVNPAGQIGGEPVPAGQQFTFTVRTQGRLVTAEDFGNIILRSGSDGSVLHLKDVARIELGAQTYDLAGRFNGKPAAIMAVYQLPGTNAVQCAKDVRTRMDQLTARFPSDMKYQVALDTTAAVNAGIHEILITLGIALALVVLVVYIFLQGWRPTLIPLLAVPVSLIGTFIVFPAPGLFCQHPFSVRPRAGYRAGGRRRYRSRRSGRETHRRWHERGRCHLRRDGRRYRAWSSPRLSFSPPFSFPPRSFPALPAGCISSSLSPSRSRSFFPLSTRSP